MRANSYLIFILILVCAVTTSRSLSTKNQKSKHLKSKVLKLEQPDENALLQTSVADSHQSQELLETESSDSSLSADDVDLESINPDSMPSDQKLGENDDEDYLVKYFALALLWMFILHVFRQWAEEKMDSYLIPTNHAIYRDVTILTFIYCVSIILHYEEVFEDVNVNWREFHLGFALFITVWLLLGISFLLAAQLIGRKWQQQEAKCSNLKAVIDEYDTSSKEAQNQQEIPKEKLEKIKEAQNAFKYAVLRHSFINRSCLPYVQEGSLRNDFNFALYLCKCMSLLTASLFQLTFVSYGLIAINVIIWWALRQLDDEDQALIVSFVPSMILIISYGVRKQLQNILSQLIELQSERNNYKLHEQNAPLFQRNRNQQTLEVPTPKYLLEVDEARRNKSLSSSVLGQVPNRHELLFTFDAFGPVLMTFFIQTIVVVCCLWFVAMCTMHIDDLYNKCGDVGATMILILVFLCWIATLVYFVPEIIKLLSITSNIEMLKKNNLIDEVCYEQSAQRAKLSFKVYRKIKQYRQKNILENRQKKSMPQIEKFVKEAYILLEAKDEQLPASKIPELGKLCGNLLDQNQIKLIAQSCQVSTLIQNEKQMVTMKEFLILIEQFQHDIALGPKQTTRWVFDFFNHQKYGKQSEYIKIEDIREFLNSTDEKGEFFTNEEKEEFLKQLNYWKDAKNQVHINDITDLISNDLDHMRW